MSNNSYTELQILRGDSASNAAYVGLAGILTADIESTENFGYGVIRLHTGDQTPGGYLVAGVVDGGGGGDDPLIVGGYEVPAFTAFTMSGSTGTPQATTLEVGTTLVGETKIFNWTTSNSSNVSANSIAILDVTGGVTIASGLNNTGTATGTVSAVTKTIATSHVYRIAGSNTRNFVFSRDFTVNWEWKMYWGTGSFASATASDITGSLISSSLVANSVGTFNFGGGGYKYIAYPTEFGLKSTFRDVNTGFNVDMQEASTISITNTNSATTDYYVHRSTNILGGTLTIAVS
jgi:hypothetical protein